VEHSIRKLLHPDGPRLRSLDADRSHVMFVLAADSVGASITAANLD